jgi:hypothetical protein
LERRAWTLHTTSFRLAGSPHDLDRPAAIGGGKDNFGAPNMLLILRPTAMPRTARSAALLDMSASTDSGRTSQAGDPSNLANAIHAISMHIQIRAVDAVIDKLDKLIPG